MIQKLKSKLLTYLFTDWVKNEYDLETISIAKQMIYDREFYLQSIVDLSKKVEVKGFKN